MANTKTYGNYIAVIIVVFCVALLFPIGIDWEAYDVDSIGQMQTPYSIPHFVGMPFAFFALPHSLLDIELGNAVNLALNILVIGAVAYRFAGAQWRYAVGIAMTTPMAIILLMNNNIDWIPLSAFLVVDWMAYPLLAMKPNVLAGAALIRFKRNPSPMMLIPLAAVLITSMLIWGTWWQQLGHGLTDVAWNFAPFPYMIPLGVYLLWKAWHEDDEIIAACATPFLVPYFAPYSLAGVHVLLAAKHRQAAIWLWVTSWFIFIILANRAGL